MAWSRVQGFVGFTLLGLVLLSALALGANRPAAWSFLALMVLPLFAVQVALAFTGPLPPQVRRLWLPGGLVLAALAWGWVQVQPGLVPQAAHPLWALVEDGARTISADPGQGRHALMRLLTYAMIFVVSLWTALTPERAATMLKAIALFSTALALFGFYAFATGTNPILGEELADRGILKASFVNRNSYATYAAFGMLANLAAYLEATRYGGSSLRARLETFFGGAWIFALGVLICIGAVSLTQSRAGAAAALVGLAVFFTARGARKRDTSWLLIALIAGVLLFVGATSATGLLDRLLTTDASDGRFLVYPAILEAIEDRPLLGHGLGAFHDSFRSYVPFEAARGEWVRAHSSYLELAMGLGLPAAGSFLLGLALIAWRLWRGVVRRRQDRIYACFAVGCIATAAFHSAFDFSLQMPATAALFAVILGLGTAQAYRKEELQRVRAKEV
jgi:O-antigen ligase